MSLLEKRRGGERSTAAKQAREDAASRRRRQGKGRGSAEPNLPTWDTGLLEPGMGRKYISANEATFRGVFLRQPGRTDVISSAQTLAHPASAERRPGERGSRADTEENAGPAAPATAGTGRPRCTPHSGMRTSQHSQRYSNSRAENANVFPRCVLGNNLVECEVCLLRNEFVHREMNTETRMQPNGAAWARRCRPPRWRASEPPSVPVLSQPSSDF